MMRYNDAKIEDKRKGDEKWRCLSAPVWQNTCHNKRYNSAKMHGIFQDCLNHLTYDMEKSLELRHALQSWPRTEGD